LAPDPAEGAYSVPPDSLGVLKGPIFKVKEGKGRGGKRRREGKVNGRGGDRRWMEELGLTSLDRIVKLWA